MWYLDYRRRGVKFKGENLPLKLSDKIIRVVCRI